MTDHDPTGGFERASGVFLHVTSLPGPRGIGTFGARAEEFVDALAEAGQSFWQVCPLGPTDGIHGHSPYQSFSAFAGNPLLIDLAALRDRGLLTDDDLDPIPDGSPHRVEYDRVAGAKLPALRTAFERFEAGRGDPDGHEGFDAFRERASAWLGDYALFRALKRRFDGRSWLDWPAEYKQRDPDALATAREDLADEIRFREFVQFRFDRQLRRIHEYATGRDVRIVGDVPIYVALDSADVWADPTVFDFDENNDPVAVAGVPPDTGEPGQKWGNPLYDWDHLAETGYEWWRRRFSRLFEGADVARVDHFKGFEQYWAIPSDGAPEDGEWREGPGAAVFEAVADELGDLPLIVEDLGHLTPGLERLRREVGAPGMRVPVYADWCDPDHRYRPHTYGEDVVGYTSTHDSNTVVGWYESLDARGRDCLHYALETDGSDIEWTIIEAVWRSDAVLAMTQVPDLLGLDSHARFNTPGTAGGNWDWRVTREGMEAALGGRLWELTDLHDRLAGGPK